jgi:hypothetical protein
VAETSDFWSSYIPDDAVPQQVRRFLHRDEHIGSWGQTTAYYAHAYANAFERLVMVALGIYPRSEYLRLPLFFLARHSAELHLKEVIQEYSAATGLPYEAAKIHSLVTLWNKVKILVQGMHDDEWSAHVGKLICHLHDFDPDGQRFRYPEDNAGKPFDGTRVELERLAHAHGSITLWCEAVCDMLQVGRE